MSLLLPWLLLAPGLPGVLQSPHDTAPPPGRGQDPPPNVLLLTLDQLSWAYLGFAGNPALDVETPNLDRLAAESTVFLAHYTDGEVCHPARSSMLTGKDVLSHGATDNGVPLPPEETTLAEVLLREGYATGAFGKVHNESEGALQGFQEVFENADWGDAVTAAGWSRDETIVWVDEEYETGISVLPEELRQEIMATDLALDFLDRHRGGPWFCYLSLNAPHPPFAPGLQAFLDVYTWEVWTPLPVIQDWITKPDPPVDRALALQMDQLEFGVANRHYRAYAAMVEEADAQIGRVYTWLESEGLLDDTIFIFTSDHGDMGGQLGVFNKLYGAYDSVARVPLLMRYPPVFPAGSTVSELSQHSDLAPTIYEILDLPPGKRPEMTGSPLQLLLAGNGPIHDKVYTVLLPFQPELTALVATDLQYSYFYRPYASDELYDLALDRGQRVNVVDDPAYASVAADFLQALLDFSQ